MQMSSFTACPFGLSFVCGRSICFNELCFIDNFIRIMKVCDQFIPLLMQMRRATQLVNYNWCISPKHLLNLEWVDIWGFRSAIFHFSRLGSSLCLRHASPADKWATAEVYDFTFVKGIGSRGYCRHDTAIEMLDAAFIYGLLSAIYDDAPGLIYEITMQKSPSARGVIGRRSPAVSRGPSPSRVLLFTSDTCGTCRDVCAACILASGRYPSRVRSRRPFRVYLCHFVGRGRGGGASRVGIHCYLVSARRALHSRVFENSAAGWYTRGSSPVLPFRPNWLRSEAEVFPKCSLVWFCMERCR